LMERFFEDLTLEKLEALAKDLARQLFPGAFLAFFGDLGAGKTSFVRAMAEEMGIEDIASPTFTIVREHTEGRGLPLYHFDAYRLSDADELYAIGFSDYLERAGVIAMEWSELVMEALPKERLEIRLMGSGEEARRCQLTALGDRYTTLLEALLP